MSSMPERDAPGHWGDTQQSARPEEGIGTSHGTMPGQQRGDEAPFGSVPGQPQGGQPGGAQGGYAEQPQTGMPGQHWGGMPGHVSPVDQGETRVVGRRVVQYVIDYVLAGIIPAIAYWLFDRGHGVLSGFGWTVATVISLAIYLWYWVLRPHSHNGQSFGMQMLGLRVISKNGGPASMAQLLVRGVLLIIDTILFGLVGLVTMLASRYHQRVGDHMARTLVVSAGGPFGGQRQYAGAGEAGTWSGSGRVGTGAGTGMGPGEGGDVGGQTGNWHGHSSTGRSDMDSGAGGEMR
jgi:uncharacterized RDD family membrane protein YckC